MKLIKEIHIDKYRVLANYKVKVTKSPFMSVLQLANEQGGLLTSEILYEELMQPMSVKACENLLIRLDSMGYFKEFIKYEENERSEAIEHVYYELTEFGKQSIETDDFYDKRNGLLEIWIAEDNEFSTKVVKVEELAYDKDKKIETEEIKHDLEELINNTKVLNLKNGAFTIDEIEDQVKFLENDKEKLTITLETNNSRIELADFLEYNKDEKDIVIASILAEEFQANYLPKENIILVNFCNQDLSLIRNHKIEDPFYKETYFNSITIPNIAVSPKTNEDAREWFVSLLKTRINKYFLSDEEYYAFQNKTASEFQLYKEALINSISRQQLLEVFSEEDFYKKAKLETIDYLNY